MTPYTLLDPLLSDATAARLRGLFERFGSYRTYVSAPQAEGVGKGLVRRHDAAMNHFAAQMKRGRTEPLDVLAARTNLFRGTYAEAGAVHPGIEPIWEHPAFVEAAQAISGRPIIEPTMLYANILVPGQELALHTDTPAYAGLDQTNTPEWLLVCMAHSGLFAEWREPMIGAVSFFGGCEGGDFVLFADGPDAPATRVSAAHNTAIVADTEALFHGVSRVGGPDHPAPRASVGAVIEHVGGDRWRYGDEEVAWGTLRFSLQWKARCHHADRASVEPLTREAVIDRLASDLESRGVIGAKRPGDTQLAIKMIQTYVRFPDEGLEAA